MTPPSPGHPLRTAGIVVLAVAGAAGIGVIVTSAMIVSLHATAAANCTATSCEPEGTHANESGRALLVPNGVLWGAMLTTAVAGGSLLIADTLTTKSQTTVSIAPLKGGAFIGVSGEF